MDYKSSLTQSLGWLPVFPNIERVIDLQVAFLVIVDKLETQGEKEKGKEHSVKKKGVNSKVENSVPTVESFKKMVQTWVAGGPSKFEFQIRVCSAHGFCQQIGLVCSFHINRASEWAIELSFSTLGMWTWIKQKTTTLKSHHSFHEFFESNMNKSMSKNIHF